MHEPIKHIFIYMNDNQFGPFSEDELAVRIKSGEINQTALIWDHLLNQWISLPSIPRFAGLIKQSGVKLNAHPDMQPNLGTLIDFSTEKIDGGKNRFIRIRKMLDISYCIIDPKTKQPISELRTATTLNISGSGIAFNEKEAPLTPGIFVDIRISFPKIFHPFRIFGEVARIGEAADGVSYDIGIKFIDLSDTLQKHFLYYLQTLLAEAPGSTGS